MEPAAVDRPDRIEKVAPDDRPGVWAQMCATCIFRPGNLMDLRPGAVKRVVDANLREGTLLICHETTQSQAPEEIVCRGFYDAYGPKQHVFLVMQYFGGFREVPLPQDNDLDARSEERR